MSLFENSFSFLEEFNQARPITRAVAGIAPEIIRMKYPITIVPSEVPKKFLNRSGEKSRDKIAVIMTPVAAIHLPVVQLLTPTFVVAGSNRYLIRRDEIANE